MDKTFNDLVDIVSRTKKISGKGSSTTTSRPIRRVDTSDVVELDIKENTETKKEKTAFAVFFFFI